MQKLILALMLLAALVLSACESEQFAKTGQIKGRVLHKYTNEPIREAEIFTSPPTSHVLTDADGEYEIEGVEPGTYKVYADAEGFRPESTVVVVTAGHVSRADFRLEPGPDIAPSSHEILGSR